MYRILQLLVLLCFINTAASAQVNLSNGLVAYYPFNGTFNDASGNGNNGTGMNGVTYGTDQWGNANNAAYFDGVDDWINVGVPSFTFGHKFSLAFRFKTTSAICQNIISRSDYLSVPNDAQFQVAFNHPAYSAKGLFLATNHQGNCLMGNAGSFTNYEICDTIIQANRWYCVVMTFNNGVKSTYVNGTFAGQITVTGTSNNTSVDSCAAGTFRIGSWWQGDPRYFGGLMDEMRVYNRPLNQPEIDSICNLRTTAVMPDTIINRYAAITARAPDCNNAFSVDDAAGFKAGDTVLMIQMKGATIDSTNTASFGTVPAYNGAGSYEQNVIKSITGNTINLRYKLKRSYDIPDGKVQFVRVPFYASYTIARPHTCLTWNGSKGGVFALNVAGTLTISDAIDVSGKGFRGAAANTIYSGVQICNVADYYQGANIDSSARKGEGIATVSAARSFARGNLANGGGGGNAHNAGGGGGSNAGAAGTGGNCYAGCNGSPSTNITGGKGGIGLTVNSTANRLFMGGGGGAGHTNDNSNADGGAGGGIVIISATSITSSGSIKAAGSAGVGCTSTVGQYPCTDGMGGGGGGGTVAISCTSYSGGLPVRVSGGNGANVTGAAVYPGLILGPGGGGGGGALWVSGSSLPAAVAVNAAGGANGVNVNQSNNAWGAQPGASGATVSGFQLLTPLPADTFRTSAITANFTYTITGCNTAQFTSTSTVAAGASSYLWSFGTGGATSNQPSPVYTFPGLGTYNVTLTLTDSNGCSGSITKPVTIVIYSGSKKDTAICSGQSVRLTAYGGSGATYAWSPATGLNSTTISAVLASPTTTTTYYVSVSDGAGCSFKDTFVVHISPQPVAGFSIAPVVANQPVQLTNQSQNGDSYSWNFGDGSGSTETSPAHLYKSSGSFRVCLLVTSSAGCSDSLCKNVDAEVKVAIGVANAFTPNGDGTNDVLYVRGAGIVTMSFRIYNRWGQQVFESNSMSQGWDGSFRGQQQEIDLYAYVVTATFIDGSSAMKKGNINLLR